MPEKNEAPPNPLLALLPSLLPLLLPLFTQLLEQALKTKEPAIVPPAPTPVDPQEDIPDPRDVPAPVAPVGRAILEVQGFIFKGTVAFPNVTRDAAGTVIGDGSYWADRVTHRKPLNNETKIMVTPTVFGPAGEELDSADWDARGWSWNIKYFARVKPDPNNPQSGGSGTSGFVGDGTPSTEITIDPRGAAANVGGSRYRNGRGRAATFKVFEEGLWEFWAEFPDGLETEHVSFVVR